MTQKATKTSADLKISIFILFLTFTGFFLSCPAQALSEEFETTKVGICRINYRKENQNFVKEFKQVCTHKIYEIFSQLGISVSKVSQENLITVVIVKNPHEMQEFAPEGSILPPWSHAVAFPSVRKILLPLYSRTGAPSLNLEVVLAHELSHIAFRDAAGSDFAPRWFTEGIAIIQSEGFSYARKGSIWWASMINNIKSLKEIEKYPPHGSAATQAYAQAADFVGYLVNSHGWETIAKTLSKMKNNQPFNHAFYNAYGAPVSHYEKKWRERLFSNRAWVRTITGDGLWLGLAALLCALGFVLVIRKKKKRLKAMEQEEKQLENYIEDLLESKETTSSEKKDPPQRLN